MGNFYRVKLFSMTMTIGNAAWTTTTISLTVAQCNELADALLEDAAAIAAGPDRDALIRLADGYRALADFKALVARKLS